jgi:acetolactate synthase I/II/III large subunit
MMKMNGAQLILRLLERQRVSTVAGIPGGAILPLYDALSQSPQIRHVLARHEQGAGFIAQGMARVTGCPGVCIASSGPGATNLLTALADAKMDSVPLVCITGQVPTMLIGTDAFQEVDTFGLTIPITKHNFLVRDAGELLEVIPASFRIAVSDRPGPVLIDVPKDVQTQLVEFADWPAPGIADDMPAVDSRELAAAAELINAAERPILYLGGGVIHAAAAPLVAELAERASIPAAMTLMALGALPSEHPLSLGMLGMHGAVYTNLALEECDVLIALGARFDDRATGKVSEFCPRAKIVHVDRDASELHKIKTAQVAIAGDLRQVLLGLLPQIDAKPRIGWLDRVAELKRAYPQRFPHAEDARSHYGLVRAVADCLDDEAIIATDVGLHQMWVAKCYPLCRPRQWLTSGGLGTMGFGLPAAIGAALASPSQTVVCFTGDGGLKMNIQELATAAQEQVNVKIVLMNNRSLGLVVQQQELFYEKRLYASVYRNRVDFVKIAEGFGLRAVDLDRSLNARDTLAIELAEPGPCLIHVSIDANEKVYPMVPPGAANREMIGG